MKIFVEKYETVTSLIDDKDTHVYTPSLEVGEGGDDEDYEREAPPPSDMDGCDWDVLSASFMT